MVKSLALLSNLRFGCFLLNNVTVLLKSGTVFEEARDESLFCPGFRSLVSLCFLFGISLVSRNPRKQRGRIEGEKRNNLRDKYSTRYTQNTLFLYCISNSFISPSFRISPLGKMIL